jgi:hypothetical protein
MTSSTPPKPSKREELDRLKRRSPLQRRERIRLILMTAGLVLAIGIFFYIQGKQDRKEFLLPGPLTEENAQDTGMLFPRPNIDLLATVKDSTATERLILESEPFESLLKESGNLGPGHLDALGSPTMDFENVESNAPELRGSPYRLRGNVKDFRSQQRIIEGHEEYWSWIRTDAGKDFFYVSENEPTELFGRDGMFVVVEGFFFKVYSQTIDGHKVTAPLFVGRGMRPSIHKADPAKELDFGVLGAMRDDDFFEYSEIEDPGYWHIMNYAATLADYPEKYDQIFKEATYFNKKLLVDVSADPQPYRGKAVILYAKPVREWTKACPENPMRLRNHSHAFVNKYEFGDQLLRIAAPGREAFKGLGLNHEMLGFFVRMWAFEDTKGNQRRTPVFIIAGVRERHVAPSLLESQIMQAFLFLFVVFVIGFVVLIRRDKKQAQHAIQELRDRRRRLNRGPRI